MDAEYRGHVYAYEPDGRPLHDTSAAWPSAFPDGDAGVGQHCTPTKGFGDLRWQHPRRIPGMARIRPPPDPEQHVGDEQLVFVNAWNEWAESAYLEPDLGWGHGYLEATRDARINVRLRLRPE